MELTKELLTKLFAQAKQQAQQHAVDAEEAKAQSFIWKGRADTLKELLELLE